MAIQIIEQNAEARLVEMLSDIRSDSPYWRVIDFHFSDLLEHYRSPVQIKIAVNLVYDLLKTYDGAVFIGQNSDITVLCRDVMLSVLDKVIFQLRYLLMDDPLAYLENGDENKSFCHTYDLANDFDDFTKIAKRRMVLLSRAMAGGVPNVDGPVFSKKTLKPFTPYQLVQIEKNLLGIDLTSSIRRQPVCAVLPGTEARRVFDELYIHISKLREALGADTDLLSNRWLFKYLAGMLDMRMLNFLTQHSMHYLASPISINLNVETVLSHHFTEFDAVVKSLPKVSVIIEIGIADVFNDIAAFNVARAQLQRMGYRVCLDGLTNFSVSQLDRERLGFDLAKLQWNAELESDIRSAEVQKLAESIRHYGTNRMILCRCDNGQAVKFGQALGITLFQGRAMDKMIDPSSDIEN